MFRYQLAAIFFLFVVQGFGQLSPEQKRQKDSLEILIQQEVHDTVIVKTRFELNKLLRHEDTQIFFAQANGLDSLCGLMLDRKPNKLVSYTIRKYRAENIYLIAKVYSAIGNYEAALQMMEKAYEINKKLGDPFLEARSLVRIGEIYRAQGKFDKAITYYMDCIELSEQNNDMKGLGIAYVGLGNLHNAQGNREKALDYVNQAIECYEKVDYNQGIAIGYNNLASIQADQGDFKSALAYYVKANETFNELENFEGTSTTANNIGTIYHMEGDYDKAIEYYQKSIDDAMRLKDLKRVANALNNIAHIHKERGNYQKALNVNQEALDMAKQSNYILVLRNVTGGRYLILEKAGDYKGALEYYMKYRDLQDSITSERNQTEIVSQEMQYQYEKEKYADSLAHQQEKLMSDLKHEREMDRQNQQRILLFSGLGVALLFGGFVFNRLRLTRKQKAIIEHAHEELEEKNQEILDSINYAKRIQTAILPPDNLFKRHLPNSFVLCKPKDIVAGDFYWMENKGSKTFFAAADCTGHGVPGAMVSVICNGGLNRSVREFDLEDPAKILDKTRDLVIQEFEKSEEEVKDGMDIALCCLEGNSLKYAGAHNPLWIIRKGTDSVEEIKANKQPIGKFEHPQPYDTKEVILNPGDMIYLFSDGFADQFGGEKGKKFKASNFKKLLLSVKDQPMSNQKFMIDEAFEKWKGRLEQLDDVCVIGVQV